MVTTVTVQKVRDISGAPTKLKDDTTIQSIIEIAEQRALNKFNVKITPTKNIDMVQIVDTNYVSTTKNPLLSIIKMKQNNYNIDITKLKFNSIGTIRQDFRRFVNRTGLLKRNNIVYIEYLYGWVEEKDYKELTTTALTAGTDVDITVTDESQYSVDNYIRIKGFDGSVDVAKVTTVTTNQITVDTLVYNHEIGSLIEVLQIPKIIDDWILYESAVAVANSAVGSTYDVATGYGYPEYNVQKGVPWTHWQNNLQNNLKILESITNIINSKLMM